MKNRKNNLYTIFFITFLFSFVGVILYFYNSSDDVTKEIIINDDISPYQLLEINKEGLYPNSYIKAFVTRIVDGDTIVVHYKKSDYRVRLLDIDTPESVKQGVPVQPYAKDALQFTKNKLFQKQVKLVFEKSLKDKYDRLLAHVFLTKNDYLNALLVKLGYARVEILKPNDTYKDYFKKQQNHAIQDKLGVWGLNAEENPFVKNNYGEFVPRYR